MKDKLNIIIPIALITGAFISGVLVGNKPKYYTITGGQETECGFIHVGEAGDEYCFTNIPLEYFDE